MCSEWSKTIFVRFALAFADNTADDGILPLKDLLGSGNSNFSSVRRKYFKIDILPKTRAKLTRAYTILIFHTDSHASFKNFEGLFGGVKLRRIHWNSPNSPTFSPAKVLCYIVLLTLGMTLGLIVGAYLHHLLTNKEG